MTRQRRQVRAKVSERALVAALEAELSSGPRPLVEVGIGDDAAVLSRPPAGHRLVWTIDTSIEGIHFQRAWASLTEIGARATHAAVSDVAAMGAVPMGILCSLVLPEGITTRDVRALGRGQGRAARQLGCAVIGGNLSRGPALELTTTAVGHAKRVLGRGGARAGDELWLAGPVGLARAGLLLLQRGRAQKPSRAGAACLRAWRRPAARVADGRALATRATACIDLSDGLTPDAIRLAEASGVRIVVEAARLVALLPPALGSAAKSLGADPVDLALEGGEDYALLATGPTGACPPGAAVIGRVETGRGAWVERDGRTTRLAGGFDHLAR